MHRKEVEIYQQKVDRALHETEDYRFRLEDLRGQKLKFVSKYNNACKVMEQQRAELKYLSKKYIAFLIYKGWTNSRKEAYSNEIKLNQERIFSQQSIIKEKQKIYGELMKKMTDVAMEMSYQKGLITSLKSKIDEQDFELSKSALL